MCEKTNATWHDCQKTLFFNDSGEVNFTIAIHNPSNIEMKKAEILVRQGNYQAFGYNATSGFLDINLTVE